VFKYTQILLITLIFTCTSSLAVLPEICEIDPSQFYISNAEEKNRLSLIDLAMESNERFNTCIIPTRYAREILHLRPEQIKMGRVKMLKQQNCATVLGFYSLDVEEMDSAQQRMELHLLFINAEYTRHGIGSILLKHAANTARNLGNKTLYLYSMPEAEPFYLKHGAIRTGHILNIFNPEAPVVLLDIYLGYSSLDMLHKSR